MENECIIAVDAGTQSIRAVLFDISGNEIHMAKRAVTTVSPRNGWLEQDPGEWWLILCSILQDICGSIHEESLLGIAIAYQRETYVVLDGKNEILRPAILWNDQRAASQINTLEREIGRDTFHGITGKFLDTTPSAVKLKWMAENEPDLFGRIAKILDVGAYLQWKLTGEMASPFAGADCSGILDIRSCRWSEDLLGCLGLRCEMMPELTASGSVVGKVSAWAAAATGLPEGLPVIAAGGDGQVSAIRIRGCHEKCRGSRIKHWDRLGRSFPKVFIESVFTGR